MTVRSTERFYQRVTGFKICVCCAYCRHNRHATYTRGMKRVANKKARQQARLFIDAGLFAAPARYVGVPDGRRILADGEVV